MSTSVWRCRSVSLCRRFVGRRISWPSRPAQGLTLSRLFSVLLAPGFRAGARLHRGAVGSCAGREPAARLVPGTSSDTAVALCVPSLHFKPSAYLRQEWFHFTTSHVLPFRHGHLHSGGRSMPQMRVQGNHEGEGRQQLCSKLLYSLHTPLFTSPSTDCDCLFWHLTFPKPQIALLGSTLR